MELLLGLQWELYSVELLQGLQWELYSVELLQGLYCLELSGAFVFVSMQCRRR